MKLLECKTQSFNACDVSETLHNITEQEVVYLFSKKYVFYVSVIYCYGDDDLCFARRHAYDLKDPRRMERYGSQMLSVG